MDQKLQNKIDKRIKEGTLRSLSSFEGMIDFVSNDYLGLRNISFNSDSKKSSTGSRLISGNNAKIEESESEIAGFFGWQSGLCFNSGYDANLGIFSSIPQKGDVVIYDEHIHASIRDGVRLSNAKSYSFKHNDVEDLKRLLLKFPKETIYIAVEGVYSMHGDLSPLKEIVTLVDNQRVILIVDEAHSCGVIGSNGRGLTFELALDDKVYIKLVTFGKAYGGHGACVLTDDSTKQYLINFSRSFIYTTALPTSSYSYMAEVIRWKEMEDTRKTLIRKIDFFRSLISEDLLISDARSAIQVLRFGNVTQLHKLEKKYRTINIAIKVVLPPTVQVGEECIRVCLHAYNTNEEIELFAKTLNEAMRT